MKNVNSCEGVNNITSHTIKSTKLSNPRIVPHITITHGIPNQRSKDIKNHNTNEAHLI